MSLSAISTGKMATTARFNACSNAECLETSEALVSNPASTPAITMTTMMHVRNAIDFVNCLAN